MYRIEQVELVWRGNDSDKPHSVFCATLSHGWGPYSNKIVNWNGIGVDFCFHLIDCPKYLCLILGKYYMGNIQPIYCFAPFTSPHIPFPVTKVPDWVSALGMMGILFSRACPPTLSYPVVQKDLTAAGSFNGGLMWGAPQKELVSQKEMVTSVMGQPIYHAGHQPTGGIRIRIQKS